MRVNSGRARNCHIDKYIGSDFDKVVTVADNINDVKTTAANIQDINTVAPHVDEIAQLADNLENYHINESFTLSSGQVVIDLTNLLAKASSLFISGQLVDRGRLHIDDDYSITGEKQITLKRSYPAGTSVEVLQNIRVDSDTLIGKTEYQDLLQRITVLENK